jgi:ribosome-associated protein
VRALADEIEYQLEQENIRPDHVEGRATGWVLMQYGGVVVHIFLEDSRQYYNLERLWDDAAKVDLSELGIN